ncbi:LysR family transcriptional regulator [Photobacterium lipolyticum]|uniref:LysR family transcriptional regulator n=1 Tax=Photobacterium lipolyticum TaxID=266810 RepID=A0A2T3N4H5_9GAMM|nr:LysR family transcriptional regulator [Photobacterium lipolyticum]PSW07389.1 LysR family transcriptional regulator [Photobacterium lipolyticum]
MKLQLENLSSFITAAEKGSFSAAGRELNKSQASISISIQNLEIDLGFELFDRTNKYPRLTEKGDRVFKNAKLMMSQYDNFIEKTKSIYSVHEVRLRVGMDPLICGPEIIQILCEFSENFPLVELFLMQQSSCTLFDEIKNNNLDLALGIFPSRDKIDCEFVTAFHMHSSWVASPDFLKKQGESLSFHDFCNSRLLLPTDLSCMGMGELKTAPQCWHVEDIHTILTLCRNGMGISFLPNFVIANDLEFGRLKTVSLSFNQLKNDHWRTSIIWPKSYILGPAMNWLHQRLTAIEYI